MRHFSSTGALLADLSHDLRTPLNGVLGFALLLHEGRLGALSKDQRECLGGLLVSARQMLQIVNEVSDLGRIEAGTLELKPERTDLGGVIESIRADAASLGAQRQIEVSVTVDPAVGEVVIDPVRLRQALSSYVINAVKVTSEGGTVAIRVLPEDAMEFRIEVQDGGRWAREPDHGEVGLRLGRRLVEVQGGRLDTRPAPGQGSILVATLPRARQP